MCIGSGEANSYLVATREIPKPQDGGAYNISLGVIVMDDSKVGDLLMVFNGEEYFFWQFYSTATLIFAPENIPNNTIN